ncbi:sugar ABC transporter permease [Bacillus sp. FJAT-49732]|uniref:Sugar ABC transporter permease n=1 Tax=Lederbergia citrisecunda TaxID=2833583 RepID=A0A942TR49_9BACI|nr:sugar ABC transporter permease [Lederbergia citrisecunda]MBS4200587.1 sugar ABC transporter permease [Lederbergia citrisecunda]
MSNKASEIVVNNSITLTKKYKSRKRKRDNLEGYLFIAPALFGFLSFTLIPVIAVFVIGSMEWDTLTPAKWAGFDNYINLFKDEVFLISLKNTILWVIYYVPASIALSLLLALAMNLPLRGISVFRTLLYIPVISPLLAVALLFVWLYNPDFGLINFILSKVGIDPIDWLTSETLALPSIALMAIWKNAGYNMLIFLAALQGIPRHLYEAAELDGATKVQKFFRITFPLLTPATFFITIMSVIGAFQVFGEIYIMTSGGPGYSTHTLTYYLWSNAFKYNKMGYACAIAVIMFILILIITLIQNKLLGRKVQYDM